LPVAPNAVKSEAGAMKRLWSQFLLDETGATAIEYGLVAAGIALAILASIQALSDAVKTTLFDAVANAVGS
jgi:pilus assembly protein Flp/PilA